MGLWPSGTCLCSLMAQNWDYFLADRFCRFRSVVFRVYKVNILGFTSNLEDGLPPLAPDSWTKPRTQPVDSKNSNAAPITLGDPSPPQFLRCT